MGGVVMVGSGPTSDETSQRPDTLVWIDARQASIVHVDAGGARIVHLMSDVSAHHRSVGHIRHDPEVRHGGGTSQTSSEMRRLEHLGRFLDEVTQRLDAADGLLVIGPGTVRSRLVRRIRESDAHHGRRRTITCAAAPRLTDRQLVARLRRATGVDPRRHSVGAYRWSGSNPSSPRAGLPGPTGWPRRVVEKPSRGEG